MAEASATRKQLVSDLKESVAALQQMVQPQQRALPGLGDKMAQFASDIDADDKRINAVQTSWLTPYKHCAGCAMLDIMVLDITHTGRSQ